MTETNTSKLHKSLGVVGFVAFLVTYIVFPFLGVQPSKTGSILLVGSYMTLLGFGHIVGLYGEIRNGGGGG